MFSFTKTNLFNALLQNHDGRASHLASPTPTNRDDLINERRSSAHKWTTQHYNAADLPREDPASVVMDDTPPPQVDVNADVNARGPGEVSWSLPYSCLPVIGKPSLLHRATCFQTRFGVDRAATSSKTKQK